MVPSIVMAMLGALIFLACSTVPIPNADYCPHLNIVSIVNNYLPPNSNESFAHLAVGVDDFNSAVRSARINEDLFLTVKGGLDLNEELVFSITRFDAPDTLTVAYIASHGSPEGFVLEDELSYDEFYKTLEARTKGTVLLLVDSCYSGMLTDVLARHDSDRIFAITGTRDASLERWYSETGSFSEALSQAIRLRFSPEHDGKITLGQLYDSIHDDIRDWNRNYHHRAGPISEPGMYGPRNLVVFDYNRE
jgi:hypothetical protein